MRYCRVLSGKSRYADQGLGLAVGLGALLLVHFALRDTYWDYSEGVYAMTAHMILHGGDLYGTIVGAQPPGVFVAGAGVLAIDDSLEWLRFGVACFQLGAGLIAAVIVWRLTANRAATVLTPAALLLTPWAVHEHGALIPELVALPILLGAALLAADPRRLPAAGVLCGLLPLIKVPLALPALVLIALSAGTRRTARWAAATLVLGLALTTLAGGTNFWRDVVYAQTQSGYRSLGSLAGYWGQATWNIVGLLVPAAFALVHRARLRERRLAATSFGLAGTMLVLFLSNAKLGTSLNVTVAVEAALVPLAVCGIVLARRWARVACVVTVAFTLAQSISLVANPRHPRPFLRLGSSPAWAIAMTRDELRTAVAAARRCPPGTAFGGAPLIAFAAGRQMAAGQPDQFIVSHARVLRSVRAEVARTPVC